ncbi:helix-turn-helix domain-containing protein [Sporosarcina sp. A2]|uniref:helix-turn-helix domain-containing protein n=1 Tax=Sporosarcina sp. A2 TaxID=3393449 RepID=UPI003D7B17D4
MDQPIGERIRDIRKENKMTLKEVAEQTGFSISFLSQLERGKSSATLESLKKLSLALQVSPAIFFDDVPATLSDDLSSETEKLNHHNIMYKSLHHSMKDYAFQPLLINLKPGQNEGNAFTHNGQEFLFVLKGVLTVLLGNDKVELEKHESIMFDSNQTHYWYNYTDEEVVFLCVSHDFQ